MRAEDPELLDCENCELRCRQVELDPFSLEALNVYDLLSRRVVKDLRLTPLVFDSLHLKLTRAETSQLVLDLDAIHRRLGKKPGKGGGPPDPEEDDE